MRNSGARLGQHFLAARWAATMLAQAVAVRPDETILEIGPGKGMLTRELLRTGAHVIAVEKDEALAEKLHETFASEISSKQLRIVTGDVRDIDTKTLFGESSYVVAANIPYYITGEILRHFLSANKQPRAMALLVQKEVAQRVVSKKESILSLSVKAYGQPRIVEKVSRKSFSPAPKVDSAILLIENISRTFFTDFSEEKFFEIIHAGFASKRKFLANNLSTKFEKDAILKVFECSQINVKTRAEDLNLGQWKLLTEGLSIG